MAPGKPKVGGGDGPPYAARRVMVPFRGGLARLRAVRFRRLAAPVLAFAMLHMSVVRAHAHAGCESAGSAASAAGLNAGHPGHADDSDTQPTPLPEHGVPATHEAPATDDCGTPASASCCVATGSCAGAMDRVAASGSSNLAAHNGVAALVLANAPLSRIGAPEPPPPRA